MLIITTIIRTCLSLNHLFDFAVNGEWSYDFNICIFLFFMCSLLPKTLSFTCTSIFLFLFLWLLLFFPFLNFIPIGGCCCVIVSISSFSTLTISNYTITSIPLTSCLITVPITFKLLLNFQFQTMFTLWLFL